LKSGLRNLGLVTFLQNYVLDLGLEEYELRNIACFDFIYNSGFNQDFTLMIH